MIYFHGHDEDLYKAERFALKLSVLLKVNVVAIEYPGYGKYLDPSGPNCTQINEDAETVYKYVFKIHENLLESDIILLGRSIGTGPCIKLSSTHKPAAMILISPFITPKAVLDDIN
jgi:abhydrolase domain-containing protein 17